ncbi:MAG TPA: hypothetical protein VFE47_22525 [Tepidisphaeraceae bacterium]|jgi:hypothetical protein|nr:hypothetical protein [Tepidisphaeraceae bacterium]
MFTQLSALFDRNFAVGCYLPALILMIGHKFLHSSKTLADAWDATTSMSVTDTTSFVVVTWFVALILYSFTSPIYRFLEGYWPWDLQRRLNGLQVRRFRRLKRRWNKLSDEQDKCDEEKRPFRRQREKNRIGLELTLELPSREELILPTSFGNVLRAFEDYSSHIYGFDAIIGWSRLQGVIPKDYRDLVDGSQANCDMWVNLWIVTLALGVDWTLAMNDWHHRAVSIVAAIAIAWFCTFQARAAARKWGEWVKASFDLHLPALCKQLGYTLPDTTAEIRKFWNIFANVIVYGRADWLPSMDKYRAKPSADDDKKKTGS